MPRYSFAAAVLICALAITGCAAEPKPPVSSSSGGGSSSAPPPASSPSPSSPQPIPSPTSPAQQTLVDIADRIGLASFALRGSADYVSQWGLGTLDGSEVRIYEFASEDEYLTYLDSVAPFGITADDFIRQGLFAVAPTDRSQIERIRAALT